MFEKRLKILLICLTIATLVLVGRAFWVQVVRHNFWSQQAKILSRKSMTETNRGRILDYQGRELAVDQSCLSLSVDYRVIPFELDLKTKSSRDWLEALARRRLVDRVEGFNSLPFAERKKKIADEIEPMHRDIELMWKKLAQVAEISPEDMKERRSEIVRLVQTRRRLAWYGKFEKAIQSLPKEENEAWYSWLLGKAEIDIDDYELEVQEQRDTHVIIPNISYELRNELKKREAEFPGVVMEDGIKRFYPYGSAACQTLGTLGKVIPKDLVDEKIGGDNEAENLKKYYSSDEIGRSGLEGMLENRLRGSRGLRVLDTDKQIVQEIPAQPGEDVKITIDIELQKQVEEAFKSVLFHVNNTIGDQNIEMQGAAVVIDIASGEVRAMASYPTYDLNKYDDIYDSLMRDVIRRPLANRALTTALEPGSTVKPIIGLGAITDGIIKPHDTIYCNGYLRIGGKEQKFGRCWTMSIFNGTHKEHPWDAPHPNNYLTFSDALERSCNVFHETLGDKLGLEGVNRWLSAFGLGRPTGIGLRESPGRLVKSRRTQPSDIWFGAIGQGEVAATPIQMANVVATIARGGIWMKPTLLPRLTSDRPETVNLHLNPEALSEARKGMINSVNSDAGTGGGARMNNVLVAGKTGSAQSAPFKIPELKTSGEPQYDAKGRLIWLPIELGTHSKPNPNVPWYRAIGDNEEKIPSHAWMITYAPANNPKLAVVAMVEYGGGGGTAAGSVIRKTLAACIKQGYLPDASH